MSDSPLSKNQVKKAAKRERLAEKYRQMKLQKKTEKGAEGKEPSSCSQIRQERHAMFKAEYDSKTMDGPTILIDCDWGNKMSEREILSLTQQIMYSYGANKRAQKPARLCIAGVDAELETLVKKLPGFDNWGVKLTRETLAEMDLPGACYLTADTEHCLDANLINKDSILVIGGLVDRNRYKNATVIRADTLGMNTAQLPIAEFMPMKTSRVLTVNHVVEILLEVSDHKDWKRALDAVIPDRKKVVDS